MAFVCYEALFKSEHHSDAVLIPYLCCFSSLPWVTGLALFFFCNEYAFFSSPSLDVWSTFVPLVGHAAMLPVLQCERHRFVKRLCLCHDETGCFTFTRFWINCRLMADTTGSVSLWLSEFLRPSDSVRTWVQQLMLCYNKRGLQC